MMTSRVRRVGRLIGELLVAVAAALGMTVMLLGLADGAAMLQSTTKEITDMTMPSIRRWTLAALLGTAVLPAASGCATFVSPSLTPQQRAQLEDYEAFAHRVTQHYRVPDVTIIVANNAPVNLMRRDRVMLLSTANLAPPSAPGRSRDFSLAHELGHWVTGCLTIGHACELDANAEAVKIIVIGREGTYTERQAFNLAISSLWNTKAQQDAGQPIASGHLPACGEIADLAKRYPQYPAATCEAGR